jgi:ribosome maturation factor RimP
MAPERRDGHGQRPGRTQSGPGAARSAPPRHQPSAFQPVDRDSVLAVLAPVVAAAGLVLEDVEIRAAGRRRIVRVLVDGEHGVSLDRVAAVSQSVAETLDGSDVLGDQPYTLEVSSPGVDRPLSALRHWRRNLHRLVEVITVGGQSVTGRITAVDDSGVELLVEGESRRLTFEMIKRAVVQVEFTNAQAAYDAADDVDAADEDADATDEDDVDAADDEDDEDDQDEDDVDVLDPTEE